MHVSKPFIYLSVLVILVSCVRQGPGPFDMHKYMDAASVSTFAKSVFDAGIFKGKVVDDGGRVKVSTDPLETALVKESYVEYCTVRGGKYTPRYVPPDVAPVVSAGYANQAVFFNDSKIGRTEFEFCTVNGKPFFAMTNTSATDIYLLEAAVLDDYVKKQNALVQKFVKEASEVTAFYDSEGGSVAQGHTLTKAVITIHTASPQITADFKNSNDGEVHAEIAIPAGIMADTERYLMVPAYFGGDMLNVTVQGAGCSLNKPKTVLSLGHGATCKLKIKYNKDPEINKLSSGQITLFLAGHAVNMQRKSELDTNDSRIWLKPRLDKIR